MRNPLISSIFIVFLFWYSVLFLFSGRELSSLPIHLFSTIVFVATSAFLASSVAWIRLKYLQGGRDAVLLGKSLRGASASIGHPPIIGFKPRKSTGSSFSEQWKEFSWVPQGEVPDEFWNEFVWWPAYCIKHPHHASAFAAMARVMFGVPGMPASPVPGGHGGATLIRHSISVTKMMMDKAPDWKYRGRRNKNGELAKDGGLFDMNSTHHAFWFSSLNSADFEPILPLVAFAHDIGKLRCYEPLQKGYKVKYDKFRRFLPFRRAHQWDGPVFRVREVKDHHDTEGARLLRRMAEIQNLPIVDRNALIVSVDYYHKISTMPKARWITDRTRSLVHLLYEVDVATGILEGDQDALAYNDDIASQTVPSQTASNDKGCEIQASTQSQSKEAAKTTSAPEGLQVSRPVATDLRPLSDPIEALRLVLAQPQVKPIAYVQDGWIFANDLAIKKAIDDQFGTKFSEEKGATNTFTPFTQQLISALSRNGWLYQVHEGKVYSDKRAAWNIKTTSEGLRKFCIIFSAEHFKVASPKKVGRIEIDGPLFSTNSATDKAEGLADLPNGTLPPGYSIHKPSEGNPPSRVSMDENTVDAQHESKTSVSHHVMADGADLHTPTVSADASAAETSVDTNCDWPFDLEPSVQSPDTAQGQNNPAIDEHRHAGAVVAAPTAVVETSNESPSAAVVDESSQPSNMPILTHRRLWRLSNYQKGDAIILAPLRAQIKDASGRIVKVDAYPLDHLKEIFNTDKNVRGPGIKPLYVPDPNSSTNVIPCLACDPDYIEQAK